jgi:hypothetical protein
MVKVPTKRTRSTDYPLNSKILFLKEAIFRFYCTTQRGATNSLNIDLIKFYNDWRNFCDLLKILSAPGRCLETASVGMQYK